VIWKSDVAKQDLTADLLDALFDAGLISFDGVGDMLVAGVLSVEERLHLGLPAKLHRSPSSKLDDYLEYRRNQNLLG